MKRILSVVLTVFMLAGLFLVPAFAYKSSSAELWPSEWHADMNVTFKGAAASPLKNLAYTQDFSGATADAIDPMAPSNANGYLTLSAGAALEIATSNCHNTLTANQPDTTDHGFVTADGSTLDLAVKFRDLPTLTTDILKTDSNGDFITTGIAANARNQLGRYSGFNVNLHSAAPYINADGTTKLHPSGANAGKPYSTEYNISFAKYDNAVKGTNAVVIFISNNANGWTTWTSSVREVYFCNLDIGGTSEYHRYTFTTDYAAGLEGEDMVTFYIDGVKATTFSAPAYRAYSDTLGDTLTMGAYLNGYMVKGTGNRVTASILLDQLSVYGTALTPKDANPSTFKEEAPLYTEDYAAAIAEAKALDPSLYSKKSWKVVADALAETEKLPAPESMAKPDQTQAQLDTLTQKIVDGIAALKYNDFNSVIDEKELKIPYAFFNAEDPNSYKYAWTNSTILFSDPNYDTADYKVNTMNLSNFISVAFKPTGTPGQYEAVGVYPAGTAMDKRDIRKAPEGGFIVYSHINSADNATSSSRYASQLFGDANGEIITQIQKGSVAVLKNVTLNPDKAATLQTSGEWLSRYDPDVLAAIKSPTATGTLCEDVLAKYPTANPSWKDRFEDFSTNSVLVLQLPVGAYLEDYHIINGKINAANPDDYTAESWQKLLDAVAAVNLKKEDLTQDEIDGWVADLEAAYEALVAKESPEEKEKDPNNGGTGEDTGDTGVVLITLGVIAFLAIVSAAVLIIGRRRGNF